MIIFQYWMFSHQFSRKEIANLKLQITNKNQIANQCRLVSENRLPCLSADRDFAQSDCHPESLPKNNLGTM